MKRTVAERAERSGSTRVTASTRAAAGSGAGPADAPAPAAGERARLAPRRRPVQARGQATVDRILDSTARLIEEVGLERLTTNLIALESCTNISTLYKFFPNKHAVLLALFKKQTDERTEVGERMLAQALRSADWRRKLDSAIDTNLRLRRERRGTAALRLVMKSSPELREYDERLNVRAAENFARLLVEEAGTTPARAYAVSRVCHEAAMAIFDLVTSERADSRHRRLIVGELKNMLRTYLAPVLDRRAEPAG